ncbi:MAG: glycosyltransferase [Propionibacteriaceae bacterium]|jgi:glycosyltransferase involved in cell wall biosynthesis|nr:glycosyltransferase [Propionibacteriaceae bacterium]
MSGGLVSLVVPVTGPVAARVVRESLAALLGQTYRALDIVCVESESTAETLRVLREVAERDPRVRVVHADGLGAQAAANRGLARVAGEWAGVVGLPVVPAPGGVARLVAQATKDGTDVVGYGWGEPGVLLCRTAVIRAAGLEFDPALAWGELAFAGTVTAAGRASVITVPDHTRTRWRETLRRAVAADPLAVTADLAALRDGLTRLGVWPTYAERYRAAAHRWLETGLEFAADDASRRAVGRWLADGGAEALALGPVGGSAGAALRAARLVDETVVTVIVPVHNRPEFLGAAVDTIRAQTHTRLEILLVDDGSTGEVRGLLAGYARADPRIRVVDAAPGHGAPVGAGPARNIGLRLARGTYCLFLDADDWFAPTLVEELLWAAVTTGAKIAVANAVAWSEREGRVLYPYSLRVPPGCDGRTLVPGDGPDRIWSFCETAVWLKLYERAFLARTGVEFQSLRSSNDVYFNMMTLVLAGAIALVPRPLVTYRRDTGDSLQDGKTWRDGLGWLSALRAVRAELARRGLLAAHWAEFREAVFRNAEYNLRTMTDPADRRRVWAACRGAGFRRLAGTTTPRGLRTPVLRRFAGILRYGKFDDLVWWYEAGRPLTLASRANSRVRGGCRGSATEFRGRTSGF